MGMPRSDSQRVDKYDAKYAATTVGLKIAQRLTGMKSDFATFANDFVDVQLLVRAALGTANTIFPIWYGLYYAYAAELWKLQNTAVGAVSDTAAQVVKTKWESRGGVSSMLIKIALDVFGMTVT